LRKGLLAFLAAAALMLGGCGGNSYSPSDPVGSEPGKAVTVAVYQGRDLFCIEQETAYGYQTYTCDFAAFYNQPAVTGSKLPTAEVALTTIPYRGKTLYCFKFQTSYQYDTFTCDFERFYRENQGDLPLPR